MHNCIIIIKIIFESNTLFFYIFLHIKIYICPISRKYFSILHLKNNYPQRLYVLVALFFINIMKITKKIYPKNIKYFIHFSNWLAGLIDGDGYLSARGKKSAILEITVGLHELPILTLIQEKFKGKISKKSKFQCYRYRLHNRKDMTKLMYSIKDKLVLESKQKQVQNVCLNLGIQYLFENAPIKTYWLTGFFEAEGYFNINKTTLQYSITIGQKTRNVLEKIQKNMGGCIYYDKSWKGFLYSASNKENLENFFNHFSLFPLKSIKQKKFILFKKIYYLKLKKYHISKKTKEKTIFFYFLKKFKNIQ